MHIPDVRGVFRFEADPNYTDLRFLSLPIQWFYRGRSSYDTKANWL